MSVAELGWAIAAGASPVAVTGVEAAAGWPAPNAVGAGPALGCPSDSAGAAGPGWSLDVDPGGSTTGPVDPGVAAAAAARIDADGSPATTVGELSLARTRADGSLWRLLDHRTAAIPLAATTTIWATHR